MGVFIELSWGGFTKISNGKAGSNLSGPDWHSGGGIGDANGDARSFLRENRTEPRWHRTDLSDLGGSQRSAHCCGPLWRHDRNDVGDAATLVVSTRKGVAVPDSPALSGRGIPSEGSNHKGGESYWVIKCPVRQSPPMGGLFFLVDTWV